MDNGCDYFDGLESDMDLADVLINDNVHGHIRLSWQLKRIIDTPQVQRLRDLKQLGLGSYVYPGATHTRFAHSIGVCYLAGKFLDELKSRQTELKIDERDIFCVQVAGLCHDLGHGPFSHTFEKAVKVNDPDSHWEHEQMSLDLFEMLVTENELQYLFEEGETDFIKELIESKEKDRKGRNDPEKDKNKDFLYEIISNKRTGIDVDKFDYFVRDCHALGFTMMFSYERFMRMARVVCCEDGKYHICTRDKEVENLVIMFQTRFTLHLQAYKHPVVCALDMMICDALKYANNHLLTQGHEGKMYPILDCIQDKEAFLRLSDSILHRIRDIKLEKGMEKAHEVKRAQELVDRIVRRQLYRLVYDVKHIPSSKKNLKEAQIEREMMNLSSGAFSPEDFYIQIAEMGFGMKDKNPLEKLYVYSKDDPDRASLFDRNKVSQLLFPEIFSEKVIRVYSRTRDEGKTRAIKEAAKTWHDSWRPCLKAVHPAVSRQPTSK